MSRLTQKDEQGNWCLKGLEWEQLHVGQVITRNIWEKLYGALWKLKAYEDTGLEPEEIMDGRMLTGWIQVAERLPDNGQIVLVTRRCRNKKWYVEQDEYYDDTGFESGADEDIIAWMPLPEPYRPPMLRETGKYADSDTLIPAT